MSHQPSPAWSVVVPTWNRPARLAECLAALGALQPPAGGFEIVVVNDGGEAPLDRVPEGVARGNALVVRILTQSHAGPAAARNHGAANARGKWLAFTDDDCAPAADWLLVLEGALATSPDALIGGTVRNALGANLFSEASQALAAYTARYFDGQGARDRFFTSNNIALGTAAFRAAGGFDAGFGVKAGEDREFCARWHAQGRPSRSEPLALVYHAHRLRATSFLRQHFAYGRGAQNFRAARRHDGSPVRVDPAFYMGSLRYAWQHRPRRRGAALMVLTVAAHAAYLGGLAGASLRRAFTATPAPSAAGPRRNPN